MPLASTKPLKRVEEEDAAQRTTSLKEGVNESRMGSVGGLAVHGFSKFEA